MMHLNKLYVLFVFLCMCAHAMEIIDSHGKKIQLSMKQKELFCASDLGLQLQQDIESGKQVDLSLIGRPCLHATNILRILNNLQDPSELTLTQEIMPEEILLLEAAHYIGFTDQRCARHLAARLWQGVQAVGPNPLRLSEAEKSRVRVLARPYMPCPARLLAYLKEHAHEKKSRDGLRQSAQ